MNIILNNVFKIWIRVIIVAFATSGAILTEIFTWFFKYCAYILGYLGYLFILVRICLFVHVEYGYSCNWMTIRASVGSYDSFLDPTRSRVRASRNRFRPVGAAGALGRSRNQIRLAGATSSGRPERSVGTRKHKRPRPVGAASSGRPERSVGARKHKRLRRATVGSVWPGSGRVGLNLPWLDPTRTRYTNGSESLMLSCTYRSRCTYLYLSGRPERLRVAYGWLRPDRFGSTRPSLIRALKCFNFYRPNLSVFFLLLDKTRLRVEITLVIYTRCWKLGGFFLDNFFFFF